MILANTNVWVRQLRSGDEALVRLLTEQVAIHPLVIVELAVGHLREDRSLLQDLDRFPEVVVADNSEVRRLIESAPLGAAHHASIPASARIARAGPRWRS